MSFCKHRVMDRCKKDGKPCIYTKECFEPEEPKPQTNADHIRSMTDEELAEFHLLDCPYMSGVYGECKYGWHDREQSCEECMLEWLKQPYKEES